MRRIHLDYQRRRRNYLGLALLAVGALAAGTAGFAAWSQAQAVDALEERLLKLERQRPGSPARSAGGGDPALAGGLRDARALENALQRRWTALFETIEKAQNPDIALLSLEPDATKGSVQITAEARNYEAMLAYLECLGATPVLRNPLLIQHTVQKQVAERPIRFSLSATWEQSS